MGLSTSGIAPGGLVEGATSAHQAKTCFLLHVPYQGVIQGEGGARGGKGAWASPIFGATTRSAFFTNAQSRFS